MAARRELKALIFRLYDTAVDVVIIGVIPLMLIALGFAFFDALVNTIHLIPMLASERENEISFRTLVEHVLDVVILIELFNTFMEYARLRHIRISTLLDVTIVFALREILIKLYAQKFSSRDLVALCIVVIVLVVARTLTAWVSPVAAGRRQGHRVPRESH